VHARAEALRARAAHGSTEAEPWLHERARIADWRIGRPDAQGPQRSRGPGICEIVGLRPGRFRGAAHSRPCLAAHDTLRAPPWKRGSEGQRSRLRCPVSHVARAPRAREEGGRSSHRGGTERSRGSTQLIMSRCWAARSKPSSSSADLADLKTPPTLACICSVRHHSERN